jgi:hypothetical protein
VEVRRSRPREIQGTCLIRTGLREVDREGAAAAAAEAHAQAGGEGAQQQAEPLEPRQGRAAQLVEQPARRAVAEAVARLARHGLA